MRLLQLNEQNELSLIERSGDNVPEYAILSHTWGADGEEVTYDDLLKGTGKHKQGYDKLRFCANQAHLDGLKHVWIDTCCINQANFMELSTAINSMFRWYRDANRCYVYLSDVPDPKDPSSTVESTFSVSRWFKRGWTLQELIAPSLVQFFSRNGQLLGDKASREHEIHDITGIAVRALQGDPLSQFSVSERLSWVANRQTTVEEDAAYCLLGMFDVQMPLIYGEGRENALARLQRKIQKSSKKTPVSAAWTHLDNQKKAEILMWTSMVPYKDNHELAYEGHVSETGNWIFQDISYLTWDRGSSSRILWIHGNVGAGKTKLIAHIIASFQERPLDDALAYFYCNRNEDDRRNPTSVLRSFVKQLSISSDSAQLHSALAEKYEEKYRSGFSSVHLSNEEAERLLQIQMKCYRRTTLIVDALDECDRSSRVLLIAALYRLVNDIPNLRIIISSRPDDDIKRKLEDKGKLEIDATKNQEDIKKFVLAKLDEDALERPIPFSDQLRNDIIDILFKKSDGMFQWASLQISQLLELERERDVRARLGSLPDGLTATYDEIYTKIRSQKESKPIVARRALQWIFSSHIPLKVKVMLAAVCQSADDMDPQEADVTVDFVLSSCHNLLVLDQGKVFRLSHLSVREYFEKNHQDLILEGISLTACVCLRLLIHPHTRNFSPRNLANYTSPSLTLLITYARSFWPNHCRAMDNMDDSFFLVLQMEFLGTLEETSAAYRGWFHAVRSGWVHGGYEIPHYPSELKPVHMALIPICIFGLVKAMEELASKSAINANVANEEGLPLLSLAARNGHLRVVKLLLDQGAHVNMLTIGNGSALAEAAARGHKPIIRLLLEHGADINAKLEGNHGSALSAAAERRGGESDVRLLLDHGADVNILGGGLGSALAASLAGGDESTARVLLEYGADVNAQFSGDLWVCGSPLLAATWRTCEWGVRLLLEHGADVNASLGGTYGSALAASAAVAALTEDWTELEAEQVIKLLLEHGADINAQLGGTHGSALAAAAAIDGGKCEWVVRLLLEHGADVNAKCSGKHGSALAAAAARKGGQTVVGLLLEYGADIDARLSCPYGSALSAAAAGEGEESVIQLLLKHGADVNAQLSGTYGSALVAAAASERIDSEAVVQLLLEHGAIANAQVGGDYGSALTAAASKGSEPIVRLLLSYGADVNAQPGNAHGSALMAAAANRRENHEAIVRLLLEHGADVNMQPSVWHENGRYKNAGYGSALAAAAWSRKEPVVRLLLEHGADINAQLDGDYGSTLAAAAANVSKQIVPLLLEHGAEINAELSGGYGSALAAAARNWEPTSGQVTKDESIANLLIEQGADINAKLNGKYGSALAAAACRGSEPAVRLLLECGADVNAQLGGEFGSALAAGAYSGSEPTMRLLLECGADVNAQLGGKYGSALVVGVLGGTLSTVRLLLENGADINAQPSGSYGSVLAAAAAAEKKPERKQIIELLLAHGAHVNAQLDGSYGSALAAAASSWCRKTNDFESVVQLLLEHGANVNMQLRGNYGSALAAAAANRHHDTLSTIRLLLEHGADVDVRLSGGYGSALAAAAAAEDWPYSIKVVRLLLEHGADVNARLGGDYGSALAAAAAGDDWGRNKPIVQLLLEHGADVNTRLDGKYGNALEAALTRRGSEPIVRLLLEHGADVDERAMATASKHGDSRLSQLLQHARKGLTN